MASMRRRMPLAAAALAGAVALAGGGVYVA